MKRQVKCFINGRYSRTWVERSQVIAGGGPLLWPHKKKVYTEKYTGQIKWYLIWRGMQLLVTPKKYIFKKK